MAAESPATRSEKKLPLYKEIIFSMIPVSVLILVLEVFFRYVPVHRDAGLTRAGFVVPDKDLIWRLKPHAGGPLATNELGFRDTPYDREAHIKILLLGDSVSWGDGIKEVKQLYPCLVEELLSTAFEDNVEVVNASVPGYSTFQQRDYLRIYGTELKPQLIILQFCLNDVVERYTSISAYGGDNVFLGVDTRSAISGLHGILIRNSRLYEAIVRLLVGIARNRQEYHVSNLARDALSSELTDAWERALAEIEQINVIAARHDIPFLLLIMPYRFQLGSPRKTDQPQRVLRKYAEEHGVRSLDMLSHFAEFSAANPEKPLFRDANHLSVDGHRLAAEVVSQYVIANFGSGEDRWCFH
jgi:lysophospholipase L1-like esterase